MRIYYETIAKRVNLLKPQLQSDLPSLSDLKLLDSAAHELEDLGLDTKPIKRDESIPLSLFMLKGVPSIKVKRLGAGIFARTYLHVDGLPGKDEDHYYAMKVFSFNDIDANYIPDIVKREIDVLKQLNRFIRHDVRKTKKGKIKHYVASKYIPGKTLEHALDLLGNTQSLNIELVLTYMLKLCKNLQTLHAINYAHGDLKPDNIMINDGLNDETEFTLIDFNWASLPNKPSFYKSAILPDSREQIPPECCSKTKVYLTPASDIYALGAVFNHILNKTQYYPQIIENCDTLISKMRHKDATKRPTLKKITEKLTSLQSEVSWTNNPEDPSPLILIHHKKQAILALNEYLSGLRTWRPYWSRGDENYAEKSELFKKLIQGLQDSYFQPDFHEKLKAGIVHYISRFVTKNLKHHVLECSDLGAGLGCFVEAVKACGDDFNVKQLINEVTHAVPRMTQYRTEFLTKFMTLLAYRDSQKMSYWR